MKNKKKTVLVTGGAGFIGSHLAEYLVHKGFKVIVIDDLSNGSKKNISGIIDKIKFIQESILNVKKIKKYFKNVDYVFHLAALSNIVPSIENPKLFFDVNVSGTLNVLECCKEYRIKKILYTASSSSYGIPKKYPTSESEKINPVYPYALTKFQGEELVMHWGKVYKLNVVSARLFNVYGPRVRTSNNYGAMFGVFLAQKFHNKPLTIVGNGNQKRDFTFISDVYRALYELIISKKSNGKIYNIGSGKTVSINKVANLIGGKKVYISKRPGEPDMTYADITKILKDIKWKPEIGIKEGVKIMLENIKYWEKAPLWNKIKIVKATKTWFKYLSK